MREGDGGQELRPRTRATGGHAVELYERTVARVIDNLRTVLTLTLVIATVVTIFTASTVRGYVAAGSLGIFTAALWVVRRRPRVAGGLAVVLILGVLIVSLIRFGPTAAGGAFVAIGVLVTRVHFNRGASIVAAVVAAATYCVVGMLATEHGWGIEQLRFATWVRTGVLTGVFSVFIALATESLLTGLRDALAELELLQRTNERTMAELARSRELETAGRLIGGVAHDVNNSLTVVACCADELRRKAASPAVTELAGDIESSARAASETMRAMLGLVRRAGSEAQSCDPALVITEVQRNLQRLLPDDVKLETSLTPGASVPLSRGALLQIITNLVLNARDSLGGQERRITLTVKPEDDAVTVSVRDTGSGMDPETLARVGEQFFSTKGAAGTGLGLSMVRATVTDCGGRLELDSEPGRGTEVRVVLPVVPALPEPIREPPSGDVAGRRVLLLEDDDAIRGAFARALSFVGARVTEASSVAAALQAIDAAEEPFELLVCDGILRDGTAFDVLVAWKRRFPAAPVVLCTGYAPELLAARGLVLSETMTIAKPVSGTQLARAVAQAIRDSEGSLKAGKAR